MAKKRKTLQQLIIPKLRDLSRYWYEKKDAREEAKEVVEIGYYKNGKVKTKNMYRCNDCKDLFEIQDTAMDHTTPVISIEDGFVDWNTYIERLFTTKDQYQCLCKPCHDAKTFLENELRKEIKKAKKKIDTD